MTLYDFPISGNCYKVRLLLSMLGLTYKRVPVDLVNGENLQETFKQLNPRGQVPVLVDNEITIWDSMAILSYLARQYAEESWLPLQPEAFVQVMQWLAVSENELLYGLARARATLIFNRPFNLQQCQEDAHMGLTTLEQHLIRQQWLVSEQVTIADVACYPYISLADEAEVTLDNYPSVRRWMSDFEALPGWIPLSY